MRDFQSAHAYVCFVTQQAQARATSPSFSFSVYGCSRTWWTGAQTGGTKSEPKSIETIERQVREVKLKSEKMPETILFRKMSKGASMQLASSMSLLRAAKQSVRANTEQTSYSTT